MLNTRSTKPSAQISVLESGGEKHLYCCQSIRNKDAAGNPHVLCAGIDLAPALTAQGIDASDMISQIATACEKNGGAGQIPNEVQQQLVSISKILNIGWIETGAKNDATKICPRSSACPREKHCLGEAMHKRTPQIEQVRNAIIDN